MAKATAPQMTVLCVHGVGKHPPTESAWKKPWEQGLKDALKTVQGPTPVAQFCTHDHLFDQTPLTWWQTVTALSRLGYNGIFSPGTRGAFDGDNVLGWTAGMVLQWAGNPALRKACRELLKADILKFKPAIIAAHSLGSLIAYDLFSSEEGRGLIQGRTLLTFGSQINSRFVAGIFERGVVPLDAGARWFHVFNPNDKVFTAAIRFDQASNYRMAETYPFGDSSTGHTDIHTYFNDNATIDIVWKSIALAPVPAARGIVPEVARVQNLAPLPESTRSVTRRPQRALLIGINDYERPELQLEGCVNDVFLVSSVLQECGLQPDEINVVLNEHATAERIRERLNWFFEDVQPGDLRFLYFSGHGVQMPQFGPDDKPDRLVEALVAHDYDGSLRNCIVDFDLSEFYTRMPRGANIIIALDCCHSGGLTRNGGPRVRGIDPPDDIRHRMLKWNKAEQMWEMRPLTALIPDDSTGPQRAVSTKWNRAEYVGKTGAEMRLGKAVQHRRLDDEDYDTLKASTGWRGVFQPMMLLACQDSEKSYEYLHGGTSYGAFTYAFCLTIRQANDRGETLTYRDAVALTREKLSRLGYSQQPDLHGPEKFKESLVPIVDGPGGTLQQVDPVAPAPSAPPVKTASPAKKAAAKKKPVQQTTRKKAAQKTTPES